MPNRYLPTLNEPAARWARFLGVVAGGVLLLWLCWTLRAVLAPLVAAWALAYILNPLINYLERRSVARLQSVTVGVIILGVLLIGLGLIGAMQLVAFTHQLPFYINNVRQWFDQRFPTLLSEDQHQRLIDLASDHGTAIGGLVLGYTLAIFANVAHWLTIFVLVPLYLFFLLLNFNNITRWISSHLPYATRDTILDIGGTIDEAVSNFFRGRVIICAAMGVLSGIGWTILGVPNSILLGAAVGVLSLAPFCSLAVVPIALILTYTHVAPGADWKVPVMLTMVVYMVVQAIESFVLAPLILAHTSGLHPVTTVIALLIGHELIGVLGLLLAIPAASTLITIGRRYLMPEIRRLAAPPPVEPTLPP